MPRTDNPHLLTHDTTACLLFLGASSRPAIVEYIGDTELKALQETVG